MAKPVDPAQSPFDSGKKPTVNPTPKKRGRRPDSVGDWRPVFIGAIMEGANIRKAAGIAGIHITTVFDRRRTDEEFKRAWKEAAEIGTEFLEQEAARRAFHGTIKPVFHKGNKCGYVNEYSDTLMIFLLKARKPEIYRDIDTTKGGTVNVSIQMNLAAVGILKEMIGNGQDRGSEQASPLALTSAVGDGRFEREVENGAASESD